MLVVGQDVKKIASLKKALSKSFAMKDLGPAKQILGMHIVQDRTKNILWLLQEKYIVAVTKVLQKFNMRNTKPVRSILLVNCKLNSSQCPRGEKDKVEMRKELIWMRDFLSKLGMKQEKFLLHCDNQSAIHLAKSAAYDSRGKHIQRRYDWLRERVDENEVALVKIHTDENRSDMLTKTLSMETLIACRLKTGLVDFPM